MVNCRTIIYQIQKIYLKDNIPWVIGFSGGKDSTTVLQMVFYALSELPREKLSKEIHVLSNDTLVENPIIGKYIDKQLKRIKLAGKTRLFAHNRKLFNVVKVKPKLEDTFWVNLIGKGYPSPNRWFRWCTERLKIKPTSDYILNTINKHGHAIIVLGTRKAESSSRAAIMNKYNNEEILRRHTLPHAFVYAPIADLSNNEVWAYLLQSPNPWGSHNKELLRLYGNACSGGECPFVIETGTQSCGKSRFGCWVCTVVNRDKSMENFVENGEKWMEGLLTFRNWLQELRQQRSQYISGRLKTNVSFGPFLFKTRHEILRRLLNLQEQLGIPLVDSDEIHYINTLFKKESKARVKKGLQKFVFRLPEGKRIVAISDFNVLLTPRQRIGPIWMRQAKFVQSQIVSSKYYNLTRVIYYLR